MSTIKYVIADDHSIFRQGIRFALADDPELICVGEASNGKELLELLEKKSCDAILLDLKMPEMGGMEVIKAIRKINLEIKIIVLTMFENENFVIRVMEEGANGYLLKNTDPDEIKAALHAAVHSGYYFNDKVGITLLRQLTKNSAVLQANKRGVILSDKEIEVLKLICDELTTAEIADKLYLSSRTVEGIRSNLLEKTGTKNIAGLALYAIRNGIIPG
jgi:DNA-binding NarL/FixJ family response regulator